MLSFAPLNAAEIEQHLRKMGTSSDEVRLRSRLACGSIGRAIEIDLAEYREMRNVLMELIEAVAFSGDSITLLSAAEYLGRKLEKDEFEKHLDALMALLADLLRFKLCEADDSVTNGDIVERLGRAAEALTVEQITEWTDRIEQVFLGLPRNVNRQLAMDAMLITA